MATLSDAVQSAISLQAAVQNLTRVLGPIIAVQVIGSGRFHIGFTAFAVASALAGLMITQAVIDMREYTGGFGADVTIDAIGLPEVYKQCFEARGRGTA